MNSTTCVICGGNIKGIWITHKRYIDKVFTLDKYKTGFQCQNCGACICTSGKRKDHPYGKVSLFRKKYHCPQCGELFVPSHAILRQDAPVSEELRKLLGETGPFIEARTYNQMSGMIDEKKWRKDENVREQILEQLKTDGNSYLYRCLEELVQEIETITPYNTSKTVITSSTRNRTSRIIWLAEMGAARLFEDGMAEEMLTYMIEEMKENIRDDDKYDTGEYPGSIFDLLMTALYRVEEATKSGKSIPAITNILLNDHSVYYRSIAALLLGFITWDSRAVDALIEALNDEKRPHRPAGGSLLTPKAPSVQERAIISLMNIGEERGLAAVIPVVGKKITFAETTDIQYRGQNSVVLLTEIGAKSPHLLVDALQNYDENALRKDIGKNIGELTIIDQIEKALDQINK